MDIAKARRIALSKGYTIEDRDGMYVLKNERLRESIGFGGSFYRKDKMGEMQLEQALVALWNASKEGK